MSDTTSRPRFDVIELSICTDCAMLKANGTLGDSAEDSAHAELMAAHLGPDVRHLTGPDTGEDGERVDPFSSWPCEGCGSHLAGERMPAALLLPVVE